MAFFRSVAACMCVAFFVSFFSSSQASARDFFDMLFGTSRADTPAHYYNRHYNRRRSVERAHLIHFSRRYEPGTVVVSFSDRRLYFVERWGVAISYPVAVPTEEEEWEGVLRVSRKRVDPPWTPTRKMRWENPYLPAHVPGGHPRNPMGPRALYLGNTLYRIHGTDSPHSIGRAISKGCIRMYNRDVIDLYERVPVGAKVVVTWRRFTT